MQLRDMLQVMREGGLSWVWWRGLYEVALRTGVLKRGFEHRSVDSALSSSLDLAIEDVDRWLIQNWHESTARFFLEPSLGEYESNIGAPERVVEIADDALDGKILFFSKWQVELGYSPDWLVNPVSRVQHPGDLHWTRIPDLAEDMGDIKYVWEPSRFPQAFYFVRAYALTDDERYPEGFWSQFESWVKANPTELGPNWRCGQEIALRSFSWLFALYAFKESKASTEDRVALMLKYLWYNAWHIEKNFWYALRCVKNNHSLSEAAGMFTIGTMFPFFPEADRWRRKGFGHFVSEAMWQIYSDGTYVQHSTNYSRLVVQLFTWCTQIARANGQEFPDRVNERFRKLLSFLWSLQDEETGRLPNYGSNDGALIFPLSSCDYLDYRPSLNALSEVLDGRPIYGEGPWVEEAVWFRGSRGYAERTGSDIETNSKRLVVNTKRERRPTVAAFPEGGYYALRGQDLFAMIRCGQHHHRPSQADMLHLDVWYDGHNVLIDPGTYSYNPGEGWTDYFSGTQAHNTISVDGHDQMKKGSRFLWIDWVHGKTLEFGPKGSAYAFIGEHQGYEPVTHRRFVALRENTLVIVDYLLGGTKEHEYTLHWLVNDFGLRGDEWGARIDVGGREFLLRTGCSHEASATWVRADERNKRGWQSLYYGEKLPAWSYQMKASSIGPVSFFTVLKLASGNEPLTPLSHDETDTLMKDWEVGSLDRIFA
jgi:hypothetical protein